MLTNKFIYVNLFLYLCKFNKLKIGIYKIT